MTVTIPASGHDREALLLARTDQLCDAARVRVASHSENAADCRDLAAMLGLLDIDPAGTVAKANPWDADRGDQVPSAPAR